MTLTRDIKDIGISLGFRHVGISPPDASLWGKRFQGWLKCGFEGEMRFLSREPERRLNPSIVFPEIKSVIVVSMNYYPGGDRRGCLDDHARGYIANYALNEDYHDVVKSRLEEFLVRIKTLTDKKADGKIYVDTGPVLEKAYAAMSGVGWMGKHSLIISPDAGSWLVLGVILLDTELEFDAPLQDRCGECTRCIEACPTGAIVAPYVVDARRCISYLLGELKGAIPEELKSMTGNKIFGCDDCQWACPWNNVAQAATETGFIPRKELTSPLLADLMEMDREGFKKVFHDNSVMRIKWERFMRNVVAAAGK
ncbi:MAG: tRNA epoxyqueuosine(34) reductase QueG [Nitrospirae bacterium]|nr:tRNA epoxyqueuosine(34) reductase QueG [Nitrospirota bacterium]